jgi:hypothetical protein
MNLVVFLAECEEEDHGLCRPGHLPFYFEQQCLRTKARNICSGEAYFTVHVYVELRQLCGLHEHFPRTPHCPIVIKPFSYLQAALVRSYPT